MSIGLKIRAGITQLVEYQLPKLNVAGSTPVTRSIILFLVLSTAAAAFSNTYNDAFWESVSGEGESYTLISFPRFRSGETLGDSLSAEILSILESGTRSGDNSSFLHLVLSLVDRGEIGNAEIWMLGLGISIPATRRDLAIALSWYGRYELHNLLVIEHPIPPDLEDDDYGHIISTVLAAGWMNLAPDGLFRPDHILNNAELNRIITLFDIDSPWERTWISMAELDVLFHLNSNLNH